METPENGPNSRSSEKANNPSLLEQIIQTAHESNPEILTTNNVTQSKQDSSGTTMNTTPETRKPRDPLTTGTILKFIGSLLFVAVIFFGSFLAYIVFNPDQAAFFVNIFGINPNDIQNLLKKLINGSFGVTVLIFSIVWIISLFRAIWIPKDQKRRKLISGLTAGVIGIFLFSMLAFWAYLFNIINATDYANLGGNVTIYDNDLYIHNESRAYAHITTTTNLVGPITLRYDLSTNAKIVAKKNLITIESYEINFDGAKCANEKSIVKGSDPTTEQGLICTFDEIRTYNIRGEYVAKDRLGKIVNISIPLNAIEIKGLLEIGITTNTDGKKVKTINASKVKNLGNPRWQYNISGSKEQSQSSITETISTIPIMVCLKLFENDCDRYFIISDADNTNSLVGTIQFGQNTNNSLTTTMTLSGINVNNNEIVDIDWVTSDGGRMCRGTSNTCEYTFLNYGTKTIQATILLANKKSFIVEGTVTLNKPLLIIQHAKVLDQDNTLLNTSDTFDPSLGGYIIKNITIPTKLTLDARDIILENSGYKIRNVTWRISHDNVIEEKIGEKVIFELPKTVRYTIEAIYTFEKNIMVTGDSNFTTQDLIIVDLERKPLEAILNIQQSSDYIPAKITVDASSSQSKNGSIQKFIFDFGEGKPQTEGDAIQTYEYRTSGEKKITVTIIDNNNEKISTSKYIVLKDTPKNLNFTTSMSPGVVALPVDFIADNATGQIEEWIWNFGDNTAISKGYDATHTYSKTGSYTVTLTVRYVDGTEKSTRQILKVESSLE